ncbi:MAG: hypothetical protein KAR21_12920 [Spirochaetales bacterium]|nr:hypothetical protein [Spirochaetales bacterium]
MKKILIIFTCILIPYFLFAQEKLDDIQIVRNLLGELTNIIENSDNDLLKENFNLPMQKFRDNELHFEITDKIENLDDSILGNAVFTYYTKNKDKPQIITIEEKLLRFYPENNSIIMMVIFHELSHAHNYYSDTEHYLSISDNKLEKYLYEMDAIYLETLFIEECKKKKYNITGFEEFLLTSLKDDNLGMASLVFLKKDNKLIWRLIGMIDWHKDGNWTIEELVSEVSILGHTLLDRWQNEIKNSKNDWNRFVSLVQMKTFDYHLAGIINQVITSEIVSKMDSEIQEINSIKIKMQEEYIPLWDFINDYSNNMIKDFFKGENEV